MNMSDFVSDEGKAQHLKSAGATVPTIFIEDTNLKRRRLSVADAISSDVEKDSGDAGAKDVSGLSTCDHFEGKQVFNV